RRPGIHCGFGVNADDLIDTRLLRRLTITAGGLLLCGAVLCMAGAGHLMVVWFGIILVLLALIPIGLLFAQLRALKRAADRKLQATTAQRQESERNQRSILQLLDEMASLADGDLTVQATVTEDITGAIADSVNYAVDALRGLVTTINQSAIHLDSAARQTQALSAHLAKASGAQSKQIASATESAGGMASATEEV